MRVESVETIVVKIPPASDDPAASTGGLHGAGAALAASDYRLVPPFRTVYSRSVQSLIVRLTADDGTVGVGECQAPVAPEAPAAIVRELLTPFVVGTDPWDVRMLWERMYSGMRDRGHSGGFMLDAISAVDIALWDLRGKSAGMPVHRLCGGAFRTRVPVYASGLSGDTLERRVACAAEYARQGFRAIKLFLNGDADAAVAEVGAVREALGDGTRLLVDVQWTYDVPGAIRLGRELERLGVFWLETPVNPEDVAGQAQVCAALDLAVASGECERTRYQVLPWLENGAVDIVQPDVGRAGGISETLRIADLAQTFHKPVALHCGVGLAAYMASSVQVAAAIPNLLYVEYQPAMHALADTLADGVPPLVDGCLAVPDAPGLGIRLKDEAVERFRASGR